MRERCLILLVFLLLFKTSFSATGIEKLSTRIEVDYTPIVNFQTGFLESITFNVFLYQDFTFPRKGLENQIIYVSWPNASGVYSPETTCAIITNGSSIATLELNDLANQNTKPRPPPQNGLNIYRFVYCGNSMEKNTDLKECLGFVINPATIPLCDTQTNRPNVNMQSLLLPGYKVRFMRSNSKEVVVENRSPINMPFGLNFEICLIVTFLIGFLATSLFLTGRNPVYMFSSTPPRYKTQKLTTPRTFSVSISFDSLLYGVMSHMGQRTLETRKEQAKRGERNPLKAITMKNFVDSIYTHPKKPQKKESNSQGAKTNSNPEDQGYLNQIFDRTFGPGKRIKNNLAPLLASHPRRYFRMLVYNQNQKEENNKTKEIIIPKITGNLNLDRVIFLLTLPYNEVLEGLKELSNRNVNSKNNVNNNPDDNQRSAMEIIDHKLRIYRKTLAIAMSIDFLADLKVGDFKPFGYISSLQDITGKMGERIARFTGKLFNIKTLSHGSSDPVDMRFLGTVLTYNLWISIQSYSRYYQLEQKYGKITNYQDLNDNAKKEIDKEDKELREYLALKSYWGPELDMDSWRIEFANFLLFYYLMTNFTKLNIFGIELGETMKFVAAGLYADVPFVTNSLILLTTEDETTNIVEKFRKTKLDSTVKNLTKKLMSLLTRIPSSEDNPESKNKLINEISETAFALSIAIQEHGYSNTKEQLLDMAGQAIARTYLSNNINSTELLIEIINIILKPDYILLDQQELIAQILKILNEIPNATFLDTNNNKISRSNINYLLSNRIHLFSDGTKDYIAVNFSYKVVDSDQKERVSQVISLISQNRTAKIEIYRDNQSSYIPLDKISVEDLLPVRKIRIDGKEIEIPTTSRADAH